MIQATVTGPSTAYHDSLTGNTDDISRRRICYGMEPACRYMGICQLFVIKPELRLQAIVSSICHAFVFFRCIIHIANDVLTTSLTSLASLIVPLSDGSKRNVSYVKMRYATHSLCKFNYKLLNFINILTPTQLITIN